MLKKKTPFKNIFVHEKPLPYDLVTFEDEKSNLINLKEYKGKILIMNFWATWCAPCKEEMPSLDQLEKKLESLEIAIFPINLEKKNIKKTKIFFEQLKIKNINFFFDPELKLVKLFSLRGVPTTILFNRKGHEFARITGSINFLDPEFLTWISQF